MQQPSLSSSRATVEQPAPQVRAARLADHVATVPHRPGSVKPLASVPELPARRRFPTGPLSLQPIPFRETEGIQLACSMIFQLPAALTVLPPAHRTMLAEGMPKQQRGSIPPLPNPIHAPTLSSLLLTSPLTVAPSASALSGPGLTSPRPQSQLPVPPRPPAITSSV